MFQDALVEADLSVPELWLRYIGLGGTATAPEVTAYVEGRADPPLDDVQHDTLVQAVNERFMEQHLDHPLPYHRD